MKTCVLTDLDRKTGLFDLQWSESVRGFVNLTKIGIEIRMMFVYNVLIAVRKHPDCTGGRSAFPKGD